MIYLSLIFTIAFLSLNESRAQEHKKNWHETKKKIEELEKVKLIEILDMNEETTLRFFSRKKEYQERKKQLHNASDELLDDIEEEVKSNGNDEKLKSMINNYFSGERKIIDEKKSFINSLNDILTVEQISKLIVFEKQFKEEIKNILFRDKMKKRKN